jgi:hypothetical protein
MKAMTSMVLAFASAAIFATSLELRAGDDEGLNVVEVMVHGDQHPVSSARGIPQIRFSRQLSECGDDTLWIPNGSAKSDIVSLGMAALIHNRQVRVGYENVSAPWGPWHCRLSKLNLQ